MVRIPTDRTPVHPGAVLAEEFLAPLGVTQTASHGPSAWATRASARSSTGSGASRRTPRSGSSALGTSAHFWLNLQQAWDLFHAMRSPEAKAIRRIRPLERAAG